MEGFEGESLRVKGRLLGRGWKEGGEAVQKNFAG